MRAPQLPPLTTGENIWEAPRKIPQQPAAIWRESGATTEETLLGLTGSRNPLHPAPTAPPGLSRFNHLLFLKKVATTRCSSVGSARPLFSPFFFLPTVLRKRRARSHRKVFHDSQTRHFHPVKLEAESQHCHGVIYSSLSRSLSSVRR